jgi:hypothetical protein
MKKLSVCRRVDLVRLLAMGFWLVFLGVQCDLSNGFVYNLPQTKGVSRSLIISNHNGRSSSLCNGRHIKPWPASLKILMSRDENNSNDDDDDDADAFADTRIQDPKFLQRNKRWIIVVDDEEDIRLALGDFLYDQGYQVTACADADSMLEVCAGSRSDGELTPVPDTIIRCVMVGKENFHDLASLLYRRTYEGLTPWLQYF